MTTPESQYTPQIFLAWLWQTSNKEIMFSGNGSAKSTLPLPTMSQTQKDSLTRWAPQACQNGLFPFSVKKLHFRANVLERTIVSMISPGTLG